jgi:hypothetical protein
LIFAYLLAVAYNYSVLGGHLLYVWVLGVFTLVVGGLTVSKAPYGQSLAKMQFFSTEPYI